MPSKITGQSPALPGSHPGNDRHTGHGRLLSQSLHARQQSLRFRLWALGLMPLLLAFPLLLAALALLGERKAEMLLQAQLTSKLATTANYLDQFEKDAVQRVMQIARSGQLASKLAQGRRDLERELDHGARTGGFDVLALASESGQLLACSSSCQPGSQLPDSFVLRQARDGVSHVAIERHGVDQLVWLGQQLGRRLYADAEAPPRSHGLIVNAAAHLPLEVESPDAILIGIVLLNRNEVLLDHLRDLIFPIASLPDNSEGLSLLLDGQRVIAASRLNHINERELLEGSPDPSASTAVLEQGQTWLGRQQWGGQSFMTGYAPILDGEGRRIGMLAAAFPEAPYTRMTWWMLGSAALLLALTMLAISMLFLHAGRRLAARLDRMGQVLKAVESGNRRARMASGDEQDELSQLARHFDRLLDTIALQERRQAQSRQILSDEASRRRALFESDRDGIVILDERKGSVLDCNPVAAQLLGYPRQELRGLPVSHWIQQNGDPAGILSWLGEAGAAGQLIDTELRRSDGQTFPAEIAVSRAQWSSNNFMLLRLRDITRRKNAEQEMLRLATLDGLTGVLNRRAWTEAVIRQLTSARRYRHPVCLMMLDADRFKLLNDQHGHAMGDAVLKALATVLSAQLRQSDLLGRVGGEEFAILLPETDAHGLQQMGARLLQSVRDCQVEHDGITLRFTVSIGGTLSHEPGPDELETLLKQADDALYQAKHGGRDRLVLADAALSCQRASCG